MKFKVGDKVRVREDLEVGERYDYLVTPGMVKYRGEVIEIGDKYSSYYIQKGSAPYAWTDEMLEPIEDPLAKKVEERNNKPEKDKHWAEEIVEFRKQGLSYREIRKKLKPSRQVKLDNSKADDPIQPTHYRKGEIDLYESWYRTYPFNEFRAGMQMIAERYMRRDKNDRIEDLEKARYTLERLKEYEVQHERD